MRRKRWSLAFEWRTRLPIAGPLGIKISLASAHLAIDHTEEGALSKTRCPIWSPFSTRRTFWKAGRQRRKAESQSTMENKRESKHPTALTYPGNTGPPMGRDSTFMNELTVLQQAGSGRV
jgi:hypothetical protein